MTNTKAIELVKYIFGEIKKATTIGELQALENKAEYIPPKNRMDSNSYPKIKFCLDHEDVQKLCNDGIIDANLQFTANTSALITDPLAKLLYSIAWKNGDLKKAKHILKGIQDCQDNDAEKDDALVFYQFGKYLTKTPGQPIIDQHVLRAFESYQFSNLPDCFEQFENITKSRRNELITKKHKPLINEYKNWLCSNELTVELKNQPDYTYYIDRLLFALGKTIKPAKISIV